MIDNFLKSKRFTWILFISVHLSIVINTYGQVDAGQNKTICSGESVQLNAILGSSSNGCQTSPVPTVDCSGCNNTLSGVGSTNVYSGQKVCILPNTTFSGSIGVYGGTLVVCGTLNQAQINFSGGEIIVIGSASFSSLNMNSNALLKNYGTVTLNQNFNYSGSTFENHGTVNEIHDFNINTGGIFINTGTFNVSNNFTNNFQVTNYGAINVSNTLNNNSSGVFNNNCTLNVTGSILNTGTFNNTGSFSGGNLTYQWSPVIGLNNPNIKDPIATPAATTDYIVTVNGPGGLSKSDTVRVKVGTVGCYPAYTPKSGIFSLNPVEIDTATGQPFIPKMYVYDRFGNSIPFDDIQIPGNTAIAGIFRLHFIDEDQSTGVGFITTTAQGNAMRAAVIQVFTDFSNLLVNGGLRTNLPNPYPSDPSSQHFIEIKVTSFLENSGTVAQASSYYLEGGLGGIAYGAVWKAITTGYDPYSELGNTVFKNVLSPTTLAGDHYHGFLDVNRFYSFYSNLSSITPASGEYDLYSVVLHEVLHMLGITTVIGQNGNSRLGQGFYSPYDALITNSSGNSVLIDNQCYGLQYSGISLTGGCNTLFFNGPNLSNQEIHTPTTWNDGSSIGHFNCSNGGTCPASFQTNGYVMNYCKDAGPSWVRRTLHPNEVKALYDLGYHITNTYGAGTSGVDLGPNSSAGARIYTITGDKKMAVAGTNDFRPYNSGNTGTVYTVQAGQTLSFVGYLNQGTNAILVNDNDFDNNNQQGNLTISCVEILPARGGITSTNITNITATSFNYNPPSDFVGQAVIRYRPQNQFGERGNITYIFINVTAIPLPACVRNQTNCSDNLVCYGGFEEVNSHFVTELSNFIIDGTGNSPDRFKMTSPGNTQYTFFSGSPSFCCQLNAWMLCGNPTANFLDPDPVKGGAQYIGMFGNLTSASNEGVALPLNTPMIAGTIYQISFLSYAAAGCNPVIEVDLSENPPCTPATGYWNDCGTFTPIVAGARTINGQSWQTYTINYTVPIGSNPLNYIVLRNATPTTGQYVFLDYVRVIEVNTTSVNITTTQISDNTPCPDQEFTITSKVCLAGGASSNPNDLIIQTLIDPRLDIVSGDFTSLGYYTIPANTLTTASPCVNLSIGLEANSNVLPNDIINVNARVVAGGKCSSANSLNTVNTVTITPVTAPNISAIVSDNTPCLGENITISYQVCPATGETTNSSAIKLSSILPDNVIMLNGGSFDPNGEITIAPNSLSSSCATYNLPIRISLNATANEVLNPSLAYELKCSKGSISTNVTPQRCCLTDGLSGVTVLGQQGVVTQLSGSMTFSGNYHIQGPLELTNGTFHLLPGTVFYMEGMSGIVGTDRQICPNELYYLNFNYIHVKGAGATFQMTGATLQSACEELWGGVVLQDGATIITEKSAANQESVIQDAYGGIYSNFMFNGSNNCTPPANENLIHNYNNLNISDTKFFNNFFSIIESRKGSVSSGEKIYNSTFSSDPSTMKKPYNGRYGIHGLLMRGNYMGMSVKNCHFEDLESGIDCGGGDLIVEENNFKNIYLASITVGNIYGYSSGKFFIKRNLIEIPSKYFDIGGTIHGVNEVTGILVNFGDADINDNIISGSDLNPTQTLKKQIGIGGFGSVVNCEGNEIKQVDAGSSVYTGYPHSYTFQDNIFTNNVIGLYVWNPSYSFTPMINGIRCNTFDNSGLSITNYGILLDQFIPSISLGNSTQPNGNSFIGFTGPNRFPLEYRGLNPSSFLYYKSSSPDENITATNNGTPISGAVLLSSGLANCTSFSGVASSYKMAAINFTEEGNQNNSDTTRAQLSQNVPNPATQETSISYMIPHDGFANAYITLQSVVSGSEVKRMELTESGYNTITINIQNLAAGVYIYSLIVDGIQQDIKSMVIVK